MIKDFVFRPLKQVKVKESKPREGENGSSPLKKNKPKSNKLKVVLDSNIGIYVILNEDLKRVYVGQSKNVKSRINTHKGNLRRGEYALKSKGMQSLQSDWNRFKSGFKFFQIHECDPDDLYDWETFFCKSYLDNNYEVYNTFTNTEISGLVCPEEFKDIIKKLIMLLDRGAISKEEIENAILRLENGF